MPYKGFTWNMTAGDAEMLRILLCRYRSGLRPLAVDESLIEMFLIRIELFLEVSPDGSTPTHATADA